MNKFEGNLVLDLTNEFEENLGTDSFEIWINGLFFSSHLNIIKRSSSPTTIKRLTYLLLETISSHFFLPLQHMRRRVSWEKKSQSLWGSENFLISTFSLVNSLGVKNFFISKIFIRNKISFFFLAILFLQFF